MIQLDLFEKEEINILLQEIKKIKNQSDNTRRGLFARFKELEKLMKEVQEQKGV